MCHVHAMCPHLVGGVVVVVAPEHEVDDVASLRSEARVVGLAKVRECHHHVHALVAPQLRRQLAPHLHEVFVPVVTRTS